MTTATTAASPDAARSPAFPEIITDALRYWEPRRIVYNLVLAVTVVATLLLIMALRSKGVAVFRLSMLFELVIAAALANLCYSAAYFIDVPVQYSAFRAGWRRYRGVLWASGTALAMLLTVYALILSYSQRFFMVFGS